MIVRTFYRKWITNCSWEDLTKPISKGGLGFVLPSTRTLILQVTRLFKIFKGDQPWHLLFREYLKRAKPNEGIHKYWNWDFKPGEHHSISHTAVGGVGSWLEAWERVGPYLQWKPIDIDQKRQDSNMPLASLLLMGNLALLVLSSTIT